MLGYDDSYANNVNIMLIIQVSLLLTSGILFLISQKRAIMKTPFKIFQK